MGSEVVVEAVSPATTDALNELFVRASVACHCRYWHFTGNKNEWLARCAFHPEENAAELASAIAAGDETGIVAREGPLVIGWTKLARRARVPKLRRLPVYKNLDLGDDETTFSIGCLLVDPARRRAGVARAMIEAAPRIAHTYGAHAIEAYPRRATEPLHDEEAWQGPEALFRELGFEVVHDIAPYPVYRKVLRGVGERRDPS